MQAREADGDKSGRVAGSTRLAERLRIAATDPDFSWRTWLRLNGDLLGTVMYTYLGGMVYGFLPQGDDVPLGKFARRLYGYRSCSARRATLRGDGSALVRSCSWFFYTDAESGDYLHQLRNPYTGVTVDCPQRMLPPGDEVLAPNSARPGDAAATGKYPPEFSDSDRPFQLDYAAMGETVWIRRNVFSRFHPGDTNWYKLEADMLTHIAKSADLFAEGLGHIPNTTSHSLVAEWQTWMKMHGAPGHILFVGNGAHAYRPTDLPEPFQEAVGREFPGTLAEPLRWS
jgi:hypothetical protein